jgi:hypothetical protein
MNTNTIQQKLPVNTILHGNCIDVMQQMPANSVDFILTDPPYLVNFRDRNGRTLQNDTNADWLRPAMQEAFRVLRNNRLMLCFMAGRARRSFSKHGEKQGSGLSDTWYFASPTQRSLPTFSSISMSRHICWRRGVQR